MSNKNKTKEKNKSIMRKQGQFLGLVSSSRIHRSPTGKLKPVYNGVKGGYESWSYSPLTPL
jgi:hypothetical protein